MTNTNQQLSLEEIVKGGQKFYFDELQSKLEKEHWDEYAVIDVEQNKYRVDPNELAAIQKRRRTLARSFSISFTLGIFAARA